MKFVNGSALLVLCILSFIHAEKNPTTNTSDQQKLLKLKEKALQEKEKIESLEREDYYRNRYYELDDMIKKMLDSFFCDVSELNYLDKEELDDIYLPKAINVYPNQRECLLKIYQKIIELLEKDDRLESVLSSMYVKKHFWTLIPECDISPLIGLTSKELDYIKNQLENRKEKIFEKKCTEQIKDFILNQK